MTTRLSLRNFDEFQKRAQELEGVGDRIRTALGVHVPPIASRVWAEPAVTQYVSTPMERAQLRGSRVRASARSTTLRAATNPKHSEFPWQAVEYGDPNKTFETYQGRRGSKRFPVTRRTQQQFPDARRVGPLGRYARGAYRRLMSAYAQTVVRTIHEVLEGR